MTLRSLLFEPETDFEIIRDEAGDVEAGFAIAEDGDEARIVTCLCKLSPIQELGSFEFSFSIVVTTLDGSYEDFETQDSTMARPFIPEDARPFVLPSVVNALRALVDDAGPELIYRVTKGRNMRASAYAKHNLITDVLQSMNYEIKLSGTDALGRRFWSMERE